MAGTVPESATEASFNHLAVWQDKGKLVPISRRSKVKCSWRHRPLCDWLTDCPIVLQCVNPNRNTGSWCNDDMENNRYKSVLFLRKQTFSAQNEKWKSTTKPHPRISSSVSPSKPHNDAHKCYTKIHTKYYDLELTRNLIPPDDGGSTQASANFCQTITTQQNVNISLHLKHCVKSGLQEWR